MPLLELENDTFLNLLVEAVATMPLSTIEFGRLSIAALQCLLSCTYEKEKFFATSEYEVFRYSAILAARQVSNDAYKTLTEQLPPTLEQINNSVQVENKHIIDHQKVAKELEPLIEFIDFKRVKGQILVSIIEPLEIIPTEIVLGAYRHKILSNDSDLVNEFRGTHDYVWDESACGSKLIIEDNGRVVKASGGCNFKSVRAKMMFENKGIFEWDVIIEKEKDTRVGVCASEKFDYGASAVGQSTGWVLFSDGRFWNSSGRITNYCPKFGDGATITVHLDMNKRTCAFTVNGTKYSEVSGHNNNIPSKLYPVVSLGHTGRVRIKKV